MADRTNLLLWKVFTVGKGEKILHRYLGKPREETKGNRLDRVRDLCERQGIAEAGQGWGDFTIIKRANWYLGGRTPRAASVDSEMCNKYLWVGTEGAWRLV